MPTLLQINVAVNTGSTGRIAEEIGQRAIAAGYDSYIAYGRAARESKSKFIRIGTKWDRLVHGAVSMLFDAHGFGSRRATKKLIKRIDEICPDVVLFHNLHGYYINIGILLSYFKDKNIPIFWTLHDCWPFTGHCSHFMAVDCERYKTTCHDCPNRKGYPRSLFFDRSRHNYLVKKNLLQQLPNLTFIPVCRWMDAVVTDSFMKGVRSSVIYNGINIAAFRPADADECDTIKAKYNLFGKRIVLGVASTWKRKKAYYDFCWLNDNLPIEYKVVLIGLSAKQVKQLPHGMVGIERTESLQELAMLYSIADVFVNPTYVDNFPTTNIEALACGTPVATYNTGGSPEAIDENTGIVVPKGDREALLKAIGEIASSKDRYTTDMCRKRAVENFDKDDRFDEYIKLFNNAITTKD